MRYSQVLSEWLRTLMPHDVAQVPQESCPVVEWAASGGMALTGDPHGPPVVSPAAAFGLASAVTRQLSRITADVGYSVEIDAATALFGRAGSAGFVRGGQRSAGGASRLLRTGDGWCAITLARSDDFASVPAILRAGTVEEPWAALETAARVTSALELAERAQLLGVPAAVLPAVDMEVRGRDADPGRTLAGIAGPGSAMRPWRMARIAAPAPDPVLADRLVVDLSSMWAGPLCGQLLGAAGARVVKVEGAHRPDGARGGDPRFFDWLHAGQEFRTVDFRSVSGRGELAALLEAADIVIEASRPRALAQLGLAPGDRPHRAGQVWLSITGHGRAHPLRVAFGDDAAVAGGLVGWDGDHPVFCGDAIADPLTGLCGALAVAAAVRGGGGVLIDLSMRDTAAAFASSPGPEHGPHRVVRSGDGWLVECPRLENAQPVLNPSAPDFTRVTAIGARC